jgi:anti-sigma factor RsiW
MKCVDIEALLCDYVDGALGEAGRAQVDAHVQSCAACAEFLADSQAAVSFMSGAVAVEPPDELITRILHRTQTEPAAQRAAKESPRGIGGWLGRLFQPVLQPRFAMGMAMTILSFSMIGRMAGIPQRPLSAADLEPAKIWAAIDTRAHRTYDRMVKYVDNLRLVYEIQNRLGEWSAQDEQESAKQERKNRQVEPAIPAVTPDEKKGDRK